MFMIKQLSTQTTLRWCRMRVQYRPVSTLYIEQKGNMPLSASHDLSVCRDWIVVGALLSIWYRSRI
jgi:hypothetical protein